MPNVTDTPAGSDAQSTDAHLCPPSKKLHPAVDRALDYYLKPNMPTTAATRYAQHHFCRCTGRRQRNVIGPCLRVIGVGERDGE